MKRRSRIYQLGLGTIALLMIVGRFEISYAQPIETNPYMGAPITLTATARRVPEWEVVQNCPGPVPPSPVASDEPIEQVELIPMGCARLRITVFPVARE